MVTLERLRSCHHKLATPLFTKYCIYTSRVSLSCLEELVLDVDIDENWLQSCLDTRFYNYIKSRDALKALFYVASTTTNKEVVKECLMVYNIVLYFFLFYKYFPKCDPTYLDIAYRSLRRDALLRRFDSHYLVVKYVVESTLSTPLTKTDYCNDLYKRFVYVKNTLNQSLKVLAKAYYRVREREHIS